MGRSRVMEKAKGTRGDIIGSEAGTRGKAYARQARDSELIGYATDIRMRAEIKAGEKLAEMAERKERHSAHGDQKTGSQAATPKLSDLGITKTRSLP